VLNLTVSCRIWHSLLQVHPAFCSSPPASQLSKEEVTNDGELAK
jgi:hypothetical protein